MEHDTQFGLQLSSLRIKRGMTQSQLAEKIDISPKTISAYETHSRTPTISTVKKIAEALSVSPDYFFHEDTNTIYVKDLEREPVLALLTVIKIFRFHTHLLENGTIQLTLSEDSEDYSQYGIKEFFKDYEIIQSFMDNNLNRDSGKEMSDKLIEHLREKYHQLPGFIDYYPPKK